MNIDIYMLVVWSLDKLIDKIVRLSIMISQ